MNAVRASMAQHLAGEVVDDPTVPDNPSLTVVTKLMLAVFVDGHRWVTKHVGDSMIALVGAHLCSDMLVPAADAFKSSVQHRPFLGADFQA